MTKDILEDLEEMRTNSLSYEAAIVDVAMDEIRMLRMTIARERGVARHGTRMNCPGCLYPGTFDEMKSGEDGNGSEFEDAIFLNSHTKEWECHECWLK